MTELIIPSEAPDLSELKERRVDRMTRRAVLSLLKRLVHGRITLIENRHRYLFGKQSDKLSLQAVITVHHPQLYTRIFFGGSIGAAEAYMVGCGNIIFVIARVDFLKDTSVMSRCCLQNQGAGRTHCKLKYINR